MKDFLRILQCKAQKSCLAYLISSLLVFCSVSVSAEPKNWSLMLYSGITAQQTFGQLISGKFNSANEYIYSGEVAYKFAEQCWLRKIFWRLIDNISLAGNYTLRNDTAHNDLVNEGNIYLVWRWETFPWNNYVLTSFGIGDGFSYASHVPYVDRITAADSEQKFQKLLNYFMVEATVASPSLPNWHLVLRLHHRCTMWGLYGHNNAGSTSLALGLRYFFK
jgi:hypothetical protein